MRFVHFLTLFVFLTLSGAVGAYAEDMETCWQNPQACELKQLCNFATDEWSNDKENLISWSEDPLRQKFVMEARNRDLKCNALPSENDLKKSFAHYSLDVRKKFQIVLKENGFYSQKIDGVWGVGTHEALEKFIISNNLRNEKKYKIFQYIIAQTNINRLCKATASDCGDEDLCIYRNATIKHQAETARRGLKCSKIFQVISVGTKELEAVQPQPNQENSQSICRFDKLEYCDNTFVCSMAASDGKWKDDYLGEKYKVEALARGLECDVILTCSDKISKCTDRTICSKATSGSGIGKVWNIDEASLASIKEAKSRDLTCGVWNIFQTCRKFPSVCGDFDLCEYATNKNTWSSEKKYENHVLEATRRELSCGVQKQNIFVEKLKSCDRDPSTCSVSQLCEKASVVKSTGLIAWRKNPDAARYVKYSKEVRLSCGVVDLPKPKKITDKYKIRKALVIGNAKYQSQSALKNAINDANAIAASLEKIGFEVTLKKNIGRKDFIRSVDQFKKDLDGSDVSLFYFAGHGIEVERKNYLIPVDAEHDSMAVIKSDGIDLDDVISVASTTDKLSLVLIDACRDNPLLQRTYASTRSTNRGIKIVEARPASNQVISFAAQSGEFAEDGSGSNSPYAAALIRLLDEPNLDVGKMFRRLRDEVKQATNGRQIPVTRNNLSGEDIFLVVQ